jgi:hypothetical protein
MPYRSKTSNRNYRLQIVLLVSIILAILAIGVWAIWSTQKSSTNSTSSSADTFTVRMGNAELFETTPAMTQGYDDAANHFIEYTDLFCPYCSKFSMAMFDNQAEFEETYLLPRKMIYELRVTDLLTDPETNPSNSHFAGMVAYCAADQNLFWQYYRALLARLKTEYYDKGIGNAKGAERIPPLGFEYFGTLLLSQGGDATTLTECINSGSAETRLGIVNAKSAIDTNGGLPFFIFNDFKTSGFDSDWTTIKQMFAAGGVSAG